MIRRGFWLATGAVLGVAGYRKAARLARTITASPAAPPALTTPGRAVSRSRSIRSRAIQPRAIPSRAAHARDAVPVTHRIQAAVGFARDVRDGMAEYRELHPPQLGRRLGTGSAEQPGDHAPAGHGGSLGSIRP